MQDIQFEGKKNTSKWDGTRSCVQGDKQIKRWNQEHGIFRARSQPAKFPNCEKEFKKNSDLCRWHTPLIPVI